MITRLKSNPKVNTISNTVTSVNDEISKVCFGVVVGVSVLSGLFAVACLIGGVVSAGGILPLAKSLMIATFI